MRSIGIDIGGSSVKAALIEDGCLTTARSSGYAKPSREELIRAVQDAVYLLGSRVDDSTPVGLCLPGKQSEQGDRVIRSINLPCLNDWVFDEMLDSMLDWTPMGISVVSDIKATAIDLVTQYELVGRVGVIAIGTGVGFAMIEDGALIDLGSGSAGHLGQLDVGRCAQDDRFDAEGSRNTLESFVGVRALRNELGAHDESVITAYLRSAHVDTPCLLALARALRVVHEMHVPDTIMLAGGIGIALQSRHDLIHTLVNEGSTPIVYTEWNLMFGDSLYHAAAGAARVASP